MTLNRKTFHLDRSLDSDRNKDENLEVEAIDYEKKSFESMSILSK